LLAGFADNAEVWNSRWAMLSFVYLVVQEMLFGPVLKQPMVSRVLMFVQLIRLTLQIRSTPSNQSAPTYLQNTGNMVMTGVFALGTVALTAQLWLNQDDHTWEEVNLDNLEDYLYGKE
jgi:hypothetical protein